MRFVLAVAAVIVRDDRVLAMRRSSAKDAGAGLWETVSGRVEADEAPLDAIAREVREETGLVVAIDPRPIDAYTARRGDAPMASRLRRDRLTLRPAPAPGRCGRGCR